MPVDDEGHAYVVVNLGMEILEQLPDEECPTCGHWSVGAALAVLTMNGIPQHVGIFRGNCAEGCDDEPILVEGHDPDE